MYRHAHLKTHIEMKHHPQLNQELTLCQHIFHIRTKPANRGGVRGCAGAGVRLILILCGYIFNMDMPRMDQLAMMVDASFGELCSVSVPWYASSGPHTAKLMIHHIDPNSDLLSGEVLVT